MDRYEPLRRRTIALVGLMGVGKSSVGRRLANALGLPFRDADAEVETAAGRSISDIFAELGEPAFREGERRVIARLLEQPPHVLATGGGAFMNPETRALIKAKADLGLAEGRPGGAGPPRRAQGHPPAAGRQGPAGGAAGAGRRRAIRSTREADVMVETGDAPHHVTVEQVIRGAVGLPGGARRMSRARSRWPGRARL